MTNNGDHEVHKIGVTRTSVDKRVKQLQTGNPHNIEVLHVHESKNYLKLEKWLHGRYNINKTEADNEWFLLSNEDVLSFNDTCRKGDELITFMLKENHFFK
jgi:CRISPR/Cas system-associated protein endoribonuclease Cas2